jgi:hypothetical protein
MNVASGDCMAISKNTYLPGNALAITTSPCNGNGDQIWATPPGWLCSGQSLPPPCNQAPAATGPIKNPTSGMVLNVDRGNTVAVSTSVSGLMVVGAEQPSMQCTNDVSLNHFLGRVFLYSRILQLCCGQAVFPRGMRFGHSIIGSYQSFQQMLPTQLYPLLLTA